jgi:hypothetical protein
VCVRERNTLGFLGAWYSDFILHFSKFQNFANKSKLTNYLRGVANGEVYENVLQLGKVGILAFVVLSIC